MTLRCSRCKHEKPSSEFRKVKANGTQKPSKRDYRFSWCRPCCNEVQKTVYAKRRDPARRKECERNSRYERLYGITTGDYDTQLAKQGGGCAMCSRPPKSRLLDVDHDHKTGKLRGLLCSFCNRALMYIRNNPVIAEAAAAYLQNPPWNLDVTRISSTRKET